MAYRQKDYTYNPKLTAEENILLDRLFKFKLSHMAEALEQQFLNPNSELEDFHTRITALINYEWDQRQTTKFNKLLRKATLKYPHADFDESLYEPDRMLDTHTIEILQACKWIDEPKNLLITGSAGAGKTHIANALCITSMGCRACRPVPSAIWWRQLVPRATISTSVGACRTSGNSTNSPTACDRA